MAYVDENGVTTLTNEIKAFVQSSFLNMIYPVGSIYLSVENTNPSTLFGGSWVQIKDTFLLSAGDSYTAGSIGGEATHTLIIAEIPSHNHAQYVTANSGGTGIRRDFQSDGSGFQTYSQGVNTGNTGGGQAHNNMPPYLVVYMWKRTA